MKIKISKSQWEEMGKKAGWVEAAAPAVEAPATDYAKGAGLLKQYLSSVKDLANPQREQLQWLEYYLARAISIALMNKVVALTKTNPGEAQKLTTPEGMKQWAMMPEQQSAISQRRLDPLAGGGWSAS